MTESIGRYTILDRIGTGALGDLYRARDTRFGRTVALRIVSPQVAGTESMRQLLLARVAAIESLSHPNSAALFDHGEDGSRLYLAHEFVGGRTLAVDMAGMALHPRRACGIAAQIADALADAHASAIVHGKLTTASIMMSPKGTAKVIGVGLAGWPDLLQDEHDDVASLGRMVAEMIAGPPKAERPIRSLSVPAIEALIRRAIGADGSGKPPPAAVLAAELRAIADQIAR
jgi:eukaryotic-like serine/threonine-protein kinase